MVWDHIPFVLHQAERRTVKDCSCITKTLTVKRFSELPVLRTVPYTNHPVTFCPRHSGCLDSDTEEATASSCMPRLDLDDYNNEVHQSLHITSMAGSWQVIVRGFAGMKYWTDSSTSTPSVPQAWDSYTFKVNFRDAPADEKVEKQAIKISF